MEVELVRSKNDMMSLNNQLLEAIQRKLELSQELEAWQVGGGLYLCLYRMLVIIYSEVEICNRLSCKVLNYVNKLINKNSAS